VVRGENLNSTGGNKTVEWVGEGPERQGGEEKIGRWSGILMERGPVLGKSVNQVEEVGDRRE